METCPLKCRRDQRRGTVNPSQIDVCFKARHGSAHFSLFVVVVVVVVEILADFLSVLSNKDTF